MPCYALFCSRLVAKANSATATAAFEDHCAKHITPTLDILPNSHRPSLAGQGTGKAFGNRLVARLKAPVSAADHKLAIVDADLATSCGINTAVPLGERGAWSVDFFV